MLLPEVEKVIGPAIGIFTKEIGAIGELVVVHPAVIDRQVGLRIAP
jgi:hypothetical protein